jgi:hypothetical protein
VAPLAPWLAAREAAVANAVGLLTGRIVGAERAGDVVSWVERAAVCGERADRALRALIDAIRVDHDGLAREHGRIMQTRTARRQRGVALLGRYLAADAAQLDQAAVGGTPVRAVDLPQPSAVTFEQLAALVIPLLGADVLKAGSAASRPFRRALAPCRRVVEARADGSERQGGPPHGRRTRLPGSVALDRPAALVTLVTFQDDAWTRVMLTRAFLLLGPLARDPDALNACLDQVGPLDGLSPALRRQLVLAGGLLGASGTPRAANALVGVADPAADGDRDVRAAALAVALCGAGALADFIERDAFKALPFAYDERTAKIRKRARAGMVLSVGAP